MEECVRLGAISLAIASAAYACSCLPAPVCSGMWSADAVFAAQVVSRAIGDGQTAAYTLRVAESFRGAVPSTVEVRTANQDAMCGYPFQVGLEYLVYAQREGGRLATGLCGGTKRLSEAGEDLRYLRRAGRLPAALSPRPSYLFGRVKLLDRWPARGAAVVARREDGHEERAVTGEDGEFDFYDLPSGRYDIGTDGSQSERLQVRSGACGNLLLITKAAAELRGRLFEADGAPNSNSELRLAPLEKNSALREALTSMTEKDGSFEFRAPPGRYNLAAIRKGETSITYYPGVTSPEAATSVDLDSGGRVKGVWFHLPEREAHPVNGTVTDENGRPVRQATVFLANDPPRGLPAQALSSDDGSFRFDAVPTRFEVWAEASSCPGVRSLRVRLDRTSTAPLRIRLACRGSSGR